MNFNEINRMRQLAGLKKLTENVLAVNGEEPVVGEPGPAVEIDVEPEADLSIDAQVMSGDAGSMDASGTPIPELTDVAPAVGPEPPSELVLVLLNQQLSKYLADMGIQVAQDDSGSKAMVPVNDKSIYTDAFGEMGFGDEDYRFEEDLSNGDIDGQAQDELTGYGDRYFPDGETSTPRKQSQMGPSAAGSGSNPMNFEGKTYESLLSAYEKFKLSEGEKGWNKSKEDAPDDSMERDGGQFDDYDDSWPDDDEEDLEEAKASGPKITAKKHEGDDKYSWAVFIDGRPFVTGLGQSEVAYYKKRAAEELAKRDAKK